MLKLNASYSKKVPAEGEYSSQSYHASVEVEIPGGLTSTQLQGKIHETFAIVRNSVENELRNTAPGSVDAPDANVEYPRTQSGKQQLASAKQLNYLLDLARGVGMTAQQIAARFQVNDIKQLTKLQCSKLIDEINGRAA